MTVQTSARSTQVQSSLLENALDRIAAFWSYPLFETRAGLALFWVLLGAICATRAYIGLCGMRVFSHDGFLVLDGAWRMVNGQRPHLDFNSMVGPAAYLPIVLGFRFCGETAAGYGYGQAMVALVVGVWAFGLGRTLSPVARVIYALALAAIAGSPALVGSSPFDLSPGMSYNRYTYALLGLVLLECVAPRSKGEFAAGLSTGAVLGLVTFLKMTGVVIEVFLVLSLLPLRRQTWQRWGGLFTGTVAAALPFLVYLHFNVGAIWRDLQMTAAAKHMVFYDRYNFGYILTEAALVLLIFVEAARLLAVLGRQGEARRVLWSIAVTIAASLALILGNFQHDTMPLLTLMLILLMSTMVTGLRDLPPGLKGERTLTMACASVLIAVLAISLPISLVSGAALKAFTVPHRPHFHAPALGDFVPVGDDISYTDWANDGFQLLAKYRHPGEHVMCLDFTNPFAFGLHIPPAAGGTTNLQYHGSFDDQHRLSAERLFGAAEVVMLPLDYTDPTLSKSVPRIYGPYLLEHYALVAQTGRWEMYRRLP